MRNHHDYYYYHVTKEKALSSIQKGGLIPCWGGSESGLSNLFSRSHHGFQSFVAQSQNKIHFTQRWEAVIRYCDHMDRMNGRLAVSEILEEFPAILRCRIYSDINNDPDDNDGYFTQHTIPKNRIQVLVASRSCALTIHDTEQNQSFQVLTNKDHNYLRGQFSIWLPIDYWDAKYFSPAYPDDPPS